MKKTGLKICGLKRREDIEMVNEALPDYAGFIVNFPKSHRSVDTEKLAELTALLNREKIKAVGVFVNADVSLPAELLNKGVIDAAQLHGNEDEEYIRTLKQMTDKPCIKAFTVRTKDDIDQALASSADYILLDQGKGSGQTFDWSLVPVIEREWFLAGGLGAENLKEAIERLHPTAVDLSSAVETDKLKDMNKIRAVTDIVRSL